MIVRYRSICKQWEEDGLWESWGAVYENRSGRFTSSAILLMGSLAEHRSVLRFFENRIEQLELTIEDVDHMLGDYAPAFQIRPQVETVEGETFREVQDRLWKRVFGPQWTEKQPAESPDQIEYTMQPAYHALRETDETEPEK